MQDSMTVYISYHADNPSIGMALHEDPRRYKLFLCDTGLFTTLAFKDRDFTENEIYEKLLIGKLDAFYNKFSERILRKYLIYTKDIRKDKDLICLPFYMLIFL